jgi:type VI secretion system protein VasD
MRIRRCSVALVASIAVGAASISCGKAPPPPPVVPPAVPPAITIVAPVEAKITAPMTVAASADANPDAAGRPSPIVVRVYQLKTDATFTTAEFFALFDEEQKVLGQELISRDEFVLAPAERRTIEVALAGETRFVGAIAAFRDIRNSQWRMLLPTPKKGLTVAVERTRVVLSPVE